MHPLVVRREVEDALSWKESRDDIFSVRSLYRSLMRAYSDPFPWGLIWAPMRVSVFAWEVSWNKNFDHRSAQKEGWNMPNRCYLCKEKEETTDHLILFCKKVTMLWSLIFSFFGVQWVLHSSIKRNLLGWHGAFVGKRREKTWRAAPLCLMWTL